jgi:hypothetical protein
MSNNAAPPSIKPNLAETAIGGDNYSHPHSIHLSIAPRSVNHLGIKLILFEYNHYCYLHTISGCKLMFVKILILPLYIVFRVVVKKLINCRSFLLGLINVRKKESKCLAS